jgi:hypothetical protein
MTTEYKDIYELCIEFEKIKDDDYLSYIKFHEDNIHSIEHIEPEKDSNHFEAKLRFISEFGCCIRLAIGTPHEGKGDWAKGECLRLIVGTILGQE